MKDFIDSEAQKWDVDIDGLLLAELRERGAIDIVQDGLYFIEEREDVLTKALLILCREQRESLGLSEKQFAKRIKGEVQDKAIAAVRGAAELFFRPSRWSEIQSRSEARRTVDDQYRDLRPMLELLNRPDMPAAMREAVMAVIGNQIEAATSLQSSAPNPSASGQTTNPPNVAGGLLAS